MVMGTTTKAKTQGYTINALEMAKLALHIQKAIGCPNTNHFYNC